MTPQISLRAASAVIEGVRTLDGVSLEARGGEFVGIIGPNGAGKTTMLRLIAGLMACAAGEVTLNGDAPAALSPLQRARLLAYLPQAREVHWNVTVAAIVALGRFAYGAAQNLGAEDRKAVVSAMESAGVAHLAERKMATLSGGETARVHFARTLATAAPIIIADEPAANLDPAHQLSIMHLMAAHAERGGLTIAALHDIALAKRFCTRIVALKAGKKIADGAPDHALDEAGFSDTFGVSPELARVFGV